MANAKTALRLALEHGREVVASHPECRLMEGMKFPGSKAIEDAWTMLAVERDSRFPMCRLLSQVERLSIFDAVLSRIP